MERALQMLVPSFVLIAVLGIVALIFTVRRVRSTGGEARSHTPLWRWLCRGMAVLSLALAALFAFAFHELYWRWRDCFNELGRCYDPESSVVYLEQSGSIWGGTTGIALVAAAVFMLLSRKR